MKTKRVKIAAPKDDSLDLLWGAEAIGKFLGLDRDKVYHLTWKRRIPVVKIGATIVARRSELTALFSRRAQS